jgi:hypothetical protein
MESYPYSPAIAELYRELMDDPARTAPEGELDSDAPFEGFERRDRLNDREWEEDDGL